MSIENFDRITISFGKPDVPLGDYEYIKGQPATLGGGLRAQVVLGLRSASLGDLIRDFCGVAGLTLSTLSPPAALVIAAAMTASLSLTTLKAFPDEFRPILELIKETPRGTTLNQQTLSALVEEQPEVREILDALVDEGFLVRKRDGSYAVKHKLLIHREVGFL